MGNKNPIEYIVNPIAAYEDQANAIGDVIRDPVQDVIDGTKEGLNRIGIEVGNGIEDLTGKNALERTMQQTEDRRQAESNRLMWERDDRIARNKETDLQAEARKKMRAMAQGGRSGTILTGFDASGGSGANALGASGGKNALGL
jgi:hypothetical protein